jgi:hypothetical protein
MERLKQLIEKLNTELDSNAAREQLMKTMFDMIRSITEEGPLVNANDNLSAAIPIQKEPDSLASSSSSQTIDKGKPDIADLLQHRPINSIRSVMGINEKYIFLQAFFKGESKGFDLMMAELDEAKSYEQASLIVSSYVSAVPINEEQAKVAEQFDQLLRRRFFSI